MIHFGIASQILLAILSPTFRCRSFVHISTPRSAIGSSHLTRTAWSAQNFRRHASVAATSPTRGRIEYDHDELSVDDTLVISYIPPEGFFREDSGLFYCGGYNGWDGEETPVMMPLLRQPGGKYAASIIIPNFAKVLDFCITDGVKYDIGPDNSFYHVRITHVREEDNAGNIILYRQEEDGTLTYEGMIERFDPQELERMIDEGIDKIAENIKVDAINKEEQIALQTMRAEASIIGEQLGLGNMQTSEARDAFDFFDNEETGELDLSKLSLVLDRLGLSVTEEMDLNSLVDRYVLSDRPDADTVKLSEFMHIFSELDKIDFGIDMV